MDLENDFTCSRRTELNARKPPLFLHWMLLLPRFDITYAYPEIHGDHTRLLQQGVPTCL